MSRILPNLPKIKAHWIRRSSDIPDYLAVPMSDNSVVRYVPEIQQPRPVLAKQLDEFTNLCIGYERKTGDCCNSQPAGDK